MRAVVVALVLAPCMLARSAAASAPLAWPGAAIGYRDLTGAHGYHDAIREAAAAWNRLGLGVTFVPAQKGYASVQIVFVAGRCLSGVAGHAPTGFQRFGARVVVRSCPSVVRPLLVAHELGRVLGLGDDDRACSLMNSKGSSDGRTFALPSRCSRSAPPSWLPRLVDPRTAALARALYAGPLEAADVRLTVGPRPRIDWAQPRRANARRTVVLRTAGRCPTRTDVAAGDATIVYAKAGFAGIHWAIDQTPLVPGSYCYRVFNVSAAGRPTPSRALVYTLAAGPTAAAAVTSSQTVAGQPVALADRTTDEGTTIVHWHWDFGDPGSGAADVLDTTDRAAGLAPSHTYAAPGTYTVSLTVTDALGRSATTTLEVTVTS